MKVAVVGATGLVGTILLKVLEEQNFPVTELIPVATEKSVGKEIKYMGKSYKIVSMEEAIRQKPDLALFSAGGNTSLQWAPEFAKVGTVVIDNSSAWRMDPDKKLIVPEINADALTSDDKIIANPNCSTIQMVMALAPLHKMYGVRRIVVSTYQSVTGTGAKALQQLEDENIGKSTEMVYNYPIHRNVIPQCDVFTDNGYTKEEMKMVNETRKILRDDSIRITSTTVRVPVKGGHSEAVNVELGKEFTIEDIRALLEKTPGIKVVDDPATNQYPMPIHAEGKDDVFVGRIRRDDSQPNTLNLWIVADNLRKGAATNAVQIASWMVKHHLVGKQTA
ncbi:MAG: Aspartate-semialdehyde dehydrogenase [Bacteroidetes bacterium ADurb.Bin397]|nr:MAG: Aspartate-semialdehyde dehydrogenase [Bacteroidetes bacterium ADurb.Bin397]